MKKYKIIKLKSGEDIIGTVRVGKDGNIKIFNPILFKSVVQYYLFGNMKELFMLKNWLLLSDDKFAVISKDAINTIITASVSAASLYEAEKNKDLTPKSKPKKPDINDQVEKQKVDPFDLIDQQIQELLEKTEKMYEQDSNVKDLAKRKPDDKMVFMNMVFSPEVIVELLRSGILDRKEFGEMINHITNTNGEGMNPGKYTGNKKGKKDMGNNWTDWNADPSSDDYK
jgi:hypothetical protein